MISSDNYVKFERTSSIYCFFQSFRDLRFQKRNAFLGKISVQPHTTLCIQFLNRENNDKNNTLPLGKQISFTIVWGCAEILPFSAVLSQCVYFDRLQRA